MEMQYSKSRWSVVFHGKRLAQILLQLVNPRSITNRNEQGKEEVKLSLSRFRQSEVDDSEVSDTFRSKGRQRDLPSLRLRHSQTRTVLTSSKLMERAKT